MTPEYFWIVATACFVVAIGYAIGRYLNYPVLHSADSTANSNDESKAVQFTQSPQWVEEEKVPCQGADPDTLTAGQNNVNWGHIPTDPKHADDSQINSEPPLNLTRDDADKPCESSVESGEILSKVENVIIVEPSNFENDAKAAVAGTSRGKSSATKAKSQRKAPRPSAKSKSTGRSAKSQTARA